MYFQVYQSMGIIGSLCITSHGLIWWNEFTKQFWSLHSACSVCLLKIKLKVLMLMFNLVHFNNCLNLILSNSTSDVLVFDIFTHMITLTQGLQSHFQAEN